MRYCEECGAQLEDDALFCENCGARCQEEEKAAPEPVTEQKEKKNTSAAMAVILIVAAAAFAVIFVVLMRGRDGKNSARQPGNASGIPSGLRADDWLEIYEIAGEYLGEYREQYCQLSIFSDGLENSDGADYPEVGVANISVWDYENETQYWFEGLSVKLVGKNIFMAETDAGDIIYFGVYYNPYSDIEGYGMDLYFNGKSQGTWNMVAHYYS